MLKRMAMAAAIVAVAGMALGWAFLKGEGTFTANGHGPFPWTEDGVFGSVTQ